MEVMNSYREEDDTQAHMNSIELLDGFAFIRLFLVGFLFGFLFCFVWVFFFLRTSSKC